MRRVNRVIGPVDAGNTHDDRDMHIIETTEPGEPREWITVHRDNPPEPGTVISEEAWIGLHNEIPLQGEA